MSQGVEVIEWKITQPYYYNKSWTGSIKKKCHKDNWSLISSRKVQWVTQSISKAYTYNNNFQNQSL
jgi:hypothetical protein